MGINKENTMGFFSWNCSVDKKSIPAYPHAGKDLALSMVVMVKPDDSFIEGVYDGYGNIGGIDVYDIVAQLYFNDITRTRADIFSETKYITLAGETVDHIIEVFDFEEPILSLGCKTMNQITSAGGKIESNFDRADKLGLVKIVRKSNYTGQLYADLEPSTNCPYQGFFYPAGTVFVADEPHTELPF